MGLTGFGMVFSFFYFIVTRLLGPGTVAQQGGEGGGPKMQFPGVFLLVQHKSHHPRCYRF
jgi:hypothetical protein